MVSFFYLCTLIANESCYKIYDCFLFFNEIDLLQVRFSELSGKVDYFVLVESKESFRGLPKPLYFQENKHLFSSYLDKIIHVVLEEAIAPGDPDPWQREFFQRNQIMRGLVNCSNQDVIIISDVDEIVRAEELDKIISKLSSTPVVACDCDFYRWFYNRKDTTPFVTSAITTFAYLKQLSPQRIRDERWNSHIFPKGGWHFSNMGGLKTFQEKLRNFSHYNDDPCNYNPENLYQGISQFQLVEIDDRFPKYIRENIEYFKMKGFIDEGNGYR